MLLKSCILLTSDKLNIRHAEFVAWQLKSPDTPEIFIGVDEECPLIKDNGLANIFQIHGCDAFDALPSSNRLKRFTYWRIPAIDQLAQTYDRILYLDTDIIINVEDALTLLSLDLQGAGIAAVRDVHQSIKADRKVAVFSATDRENAAYFNAGMLVIDGIKWRESGALKLILDIGRRYPEAMTTHDQSLLNIYGYNNWLEISPIWNWQVSRRNICLIEKLNARVIHLVGENKLWSDIALPKFFNKYTNQYKNFLRDMYQEDLPPKKALHPVVWAHFMVKALYYKQKYKKRCMAFKNSAQGRLCEKQN